MQLLLQIVPADYLALYEKAIVMKKRYYTYIKTMEYLNSNYRVVIR